MQEGKIIRSLSGFYDVLTTEGITRCRARGRFRKDKITPLVGDDVKFDIETESLGYVLEVLDRKNSFVRPPVANVDQVLLVFSATEPTFNPQLLDRFLVLVEAERVEPVILISKIDLLQGKEREQIETYASIYRQIGYEVILTSILDEKSHKKVKEKIDGKISVIAGQSGVGKSSLLNAIDSSLQLNTGEISKHLGRGKHTTRHVELIEVGNGYVADTPGFSNLDITHIEKEQLSDCFLEMKKVKGACKFRGCLHLKEPKCEVKRLVETGEFARFRYENYVTFLQEIEEKRRY
ncbi:MAG TPA: ribosome small subunit-dependent GTPase A [Massilibacterium sp.]|nr:ribosome small subunit-dependent GTPase A [Massilibacterium sp.]